MEMKVRLPSSVPVMMQRKDVGMVSAGVVGLGVMVKFVGPSGAISVVVEDMVVEVAVVLEGTSVVDVSVEIVVSFPGLMVVVEEVMIVVDVVAVMLGSVGTSEGGRPGRSTQSKSVKSLLY